MGLEFQRDRDEFFETCVDSGSFPRNDALKTIVLAKIVDPFDVGEVYTKSELDDVIRRHFDDHVLVRRELVNFGYVRYDNTANEYTVERLALTEAQAREITRLERHAEDLGALE